jgi:hypothetical protein
MVLGAVWCPTEQRLSISEDLRRIRQDYFGNRLHELKWVKVSPSNLKLYGRVIDYFFDCPDLHFRCVVIPDKQILDHAARGQDHDTWYYKMYFNLLKVILEPGNGHFIYLDYKDTHSATKTRKLGEVLRNNAYDFERQIVRRIQPVRSEEVMLIQLVDLLTGVVSYINRGKLVSSAKRILVERVRRLSGYSLTATTLLREYKFNILRWSPKED